MTRVHTSRRRRQALGVSIVLALICAACGDDDSGDSAATADGESETTEPATDEPAANDTADASGELTSITVAVPNTACFTYVPMYVAMHRGIYEAEGLEVDVQGVDGSSAVIQALVAGNADFGIPSPVLVMGAVERGEEMTTFYNVKPGGSHSVIVEADSGISEAADLEGKTIGIATADGSEVAFAKAVTDAVGLVEGEDFEFLVVGDGGPAVAGFTRGDIDAYASSYADTAVITQAGLEVMDITPASVRAYFFGNGLTAMSSTIEEHPEWVESFARGFAAGSVQAWENPEDTLDVCEEVNPPEVEDREFAAALLTEFEKPFAPLGDDPWGYFGEGSWETLMQAAIDSGSLEGPVDLEVAYTNQFVDATQP